MKLSIILLMLAFLITFGTPAGIFADARGEGEQEQKYQSILKKLKASPEHYNQLLNNYRSFQALPKEKQKTLKDLDDAIYQLIKSYDYFQTLGKEKQIALKKTAVKSDSQEAGRLIEVFQKFGEWHEALDETEKDSLAKASHPDGRIAEIKKILTSQWISRLPKVDSDALLKLDEPMRAIQIAKMKKEEQIRVAQSFDKKKKGGLYLEETQKFITQIKQQLSSEQLEKVGKLEGKKAAFVKMILDFAEDNPPLPLNKMGIKYLSSKDLPTEVSAQLKSLKQIGVYKSVELTKIEKKWPAYARGVTEIIRRSDPSFNYEFGACKFEDLPEDTRTVVENELIQMLQDDEKVKLQLVEGKWPDYPLMLRDLARVHLVTIPGISIPPELLQLKPGKVPMMLR